MTTGTDPLALLRAGKLDGAAALDLSGCGLTELPPELYGLADTLEILDLGRNALAGLPPDLPRFRRLRVLFCSGAPMRVLPPVLGDCASLTQIGFRGAALETVPAEALPPGLRWLTLTDNRIATLPAALGERPQLRKLMLAGNLLSALPATLAGHASLELLRFAANRFERVPAFLAELPRLAWLGFAGNPASTMRDAAARPVATIPAASLRIGALLGEGASGHVHAASWVGGDGAAPREVALKLFKDAMSSDGAPQAEIEASLGAGAHDHLLGALGRVDDHPGGRVGLVLPLLPRDWAVLAGPPSLESCTRDVYAPGFALPPGAARAIARCVAQAAASLAGAGWLHGDLYAHNIHWDGAAGRAVLGDLGAATPLATDATRDLAACDVLAWGILAGELLAAAPAGETNAALAETARRATAPGAADRPDFAGIVSALDLER